MVWWSSGGRPDDGPLRAGQATWTLYLATSNVIHSAQLLRAWGGRVLNGPVQLPGHDMMVIGVDSVGAVIGFYEPARTRRSGRMGPVYWAQLDTWDDPAADAFYAVLFGYQHQNRRRRRRRLHHLVSARTPDVGPVTDAPGLDRSHQNAQWMLHFAVHPGWAPTLPPIGSWRWMVRWTSIPTTPSSGASPGSPIPAEPPSP
jgi:predicted enzyme related to lactoylglutathione lyase